MEAILEVFIAAVAVLFELIAALIGAVVELVAMLIAFLLTWRREGRKAASEQFLRRTSERKRKQEEKSKSKKTSKQEPSLDEDPTDSASPMQTAEKRPNSSRWLIVLGLCIVAAGGLAWYLHERKLERQIAQTQAIQKRLADDFADQVQGGAGDELKPSTLNQTDAWGQPLELFVDRFPIGTLIVIRSNGPDRQSGTIDDLLEIRPVPVTPKGIAKDLADVAVEKGKQEAKSRLDALKEKAARFLPGKWKNQDDVDPQ